MNDKLHILYISSASLVNGPGTASRGHISLLKNGGYDVDVLTLYREPSLPEVMFVKKKSIAIKFVDIFKRFFLRKHFPGYPHYFFYKKETQPPVPVSKVLETIKKDYNLVIIYFWQNLLSFRTVEAIYDKLNHPLFFFLSPDYSHMSGGCHFTCDCQRYQTGCGCCPAWNSKDEGDFTHWNFQDRIRIYEKVKPVVFGNSYMNIFYQKSLLLRNARIEIYPPYFDTSRFNPVEKSIARAKFGISKLKSFIIAFGCQELLDPRKGIDYLEKALLVFESKLPKDERKSILLLVAGKDFDSIKDSLPFSSIGVGYLPLNRLAEFYSAADIFICPSVDDAGPLMVSQSIACGTPVVGFKMGAMLDCVYNKGTGYCAELKDCEDLASGIEKYYLMSKEDYENASIRCVEFAREHSNPVKRVNRWIEIYNKYKSM